MTPHEAFTIGMIWGTLNRTRDKSMPFTVECPGNMTHLVLRWKSGTEVLVTVTETRTPPEPEV